MTTTTEPDGFASVMRRIEQRREQRRAENTVERAALLDLVRAAGITEITASYDGWGDSGNVDDVEMQPAEKAAVATAEMKTRLQGFIWDIVYSLHPGFENNEGGQGEFTWRIAEDEIDISHGDNYTEISYTEHEGI